jgi:hypothetical protein
MTKELLQPDSARVVYDIRKDNISVEKMQKTSLSDGDWGLTVDHGVVGSETWWSSIKTGTIILKSFDGVIRVVSGGMKGDTLEVHIEAPDGIQRWVAWRGFDVALNGKNVCVRFVEMRPKKPFPNRPGFLVPVLLQVEVLD